ncbi:C45 family autoproteolytic acyltransferase/hydolase [Labrys wisconsinensis]|uniref:Choloylglycine hydrolase n=1 Tax=Labrys wisconsinensis TaxID=425677 RepID=A0ABU0JIU8_9HYPH|nr:C45 family autoproteolytic acyltransferase/hydolase [Labrys wisconsinensis]MDQ0474200.1 putative choloylglycine hydrolase [Labrys wisconsinensis]
MWKQFVAEREDQPGPAWLARFRAGREEAERWYRGRGPADRPTAAECRTALRRHMPELLPHYDRVCALVGDDELAHRILSQYRPAPVAHGCSQAIWLGGDGPALVRNYDYPLDIVSDRFELTAWSGRRVIGKAQRPWGGLLDGMNEDGLVASLAHGGGRAQGLGFSIILMLRCVLETCSRVAEAVEMLKTIPVAQSQNVVLLDRTGGHAILFLGPDRVPAVSEALACTNHQEEALARSGSVVRQQALLDGLAAPGASLADLVRRFLEPPVHVRQGGAATVYSAVYRPAAGRVDYIWPGKIWGQSFARFEEGAYRHDYGEAQG